MTRYLLSVHMTDGQDRPTMDDEATQRSWHAIEALETELKSSGAWVASARLTEAADARVVRASGRGKPQVTDGPFAETKEHIGGFYIIEASDLDAAVEWAARVSDTIQAPIEVRPFAGYAD